MEVQMLEKFEREISVTGHHDKELKFSDLLQMFQHHATTDDYFQLQNLQQMIQICRLTDLDAFYSNSSGNNMTNTPDSDSCTSTGMKIHLLTIRELFLFASAPNVEPEEIEVLSALKTFVREYVLSNRRRISLDNVRLHLDDHAGVDDDSNTTPSSEATTAGGAAILEQESCSTILKADHADGHRPETPLQMNYGTSNGAEVSRTDAGEQQGTALHQVENEAEMLSMSSSGKNRHFSIQDVLRLESCHKICDLYLWLANHFERNFIYTGATDEHTSSADDQGMGIKIFTGATATSSSSRVFSEEDLRKAKRIRKNCAAKILKLLEMRLELEESIDTSALSLVEQENACAEDEDERGDEGKYSAASTTSTSSSTFDASCEANEVEVDIDPEPQHDDDNNDPSTSGTSCSV
ncbi:unnamed protein product [Amoebophrya sp. A120]|nr:unnamed protein product [Amoebophrya sp. A120]|eukprot:GSA120T00009898001.1